MTDLQDQLEQLETELAEATRQQALLNARISGLRAHRDALLQLSDQTAATVASDHRPDAGQDLTSLSKSDAIVAVLEQAQGPMSIRQIVEALHEAGRKFESYNGISVYLQNLLIEGRVRRPARGRYVADKTP